MAQRPGTPKLLRELNNRAALELLISAGPLTRTQIGEQTGLSKVTASQLLSRLEERGLVEVVGAQAGGRGPNAALYGVVPASAYVAGLEVGPTGVTAAVADITGEIAGQATVDGSANPVGVVHEAVTGACKAAAITVSQLAEVVIGTPGVVDPRSGDVQFVFDLPHWHDGVLDRLTADLQRPVVIENDVNLVAVAEREFGIAQPADNFALIWLGRGIGLAVMLNRQLHRGQSGAAGEIGYLPVPGVPLPDEVGESESWGKPALAGGFGSLIGADAVLELAGKHGWHADTAVACVEDATADVDGGTAFLGELATRISYGVASVNIVLDPGLLVIAGPLGRAGGSRLAELVQREVGRICPTQPAVAVTEVDGNPVLRGALSAALERAREAVFSSTTES
jgi:predicted NBD/HSP70 family sugar kinase